MKRVKFENVRKIDVIGMAIIGGFTLLALLEVVQPQMQASEAATVQREALTEARGNTTELNATLELAKKRLRNVSQTLESGPFKLQSASQINSRLVELTDLATQEGLTIRNLQPGSVVSQPRFQIVQIDLSGTGSYRSAASFMHRVHEVFKDMSIGAFSLSVESDEGGNKMIYRFSLSWFVRPSDKG